MRRITTPIHYTYPQPAPRRAGLSTWSKFNEHRWSEFNAHEQEANHKRKIARGEWSSVWDKPQIPEHDVVPSGLLMVEIDRSSGYDGIRRKFSDGKQQRIENMADKIVTTAAVCAAAAIERRDEAARREREWSEMEKRRKEAERRHTLENKRWEFLEAKMERLELAQQINGFVSE